MDINVPDLIKVIDVLKGSLQGFDSINIGEKDYYWDVASSDLYDVDNKPTNFYLQQLSFDWENLLRLKNKNEGPITNDLKILGAVLRAIEDSNTIAL